MTHRHPIAIVGTGVIGRSWIRVFARTGRPVRAFDADDRSLDRAMTWLDASLDDDVAAGFESAASAAAQRAGVRATGSLRDALEGAVYVQESGPEPLDLKRAIFAQLERAAPPHAILATSTSTHDIADIAGDLDTVDRCIVAHPVNPPHVVPLVEVLGSSRTSPATLHDTCEILREAGQAPVVLERYVPGFLLNRLQAALIREAVHLVATGAASLDAVDAVVRDGLGLRWALMGPFGVADANADNGVAEYFDRYGDAYLRLMSDLGPVPIFDRPLLDSLDAQTRQMHGGAGRADIRAWRDRMVRRIRALKAEDPRPGCR